MITIVGAIVEREGKYLMVERLKRSRGYFEFPGGKLEEGESDQSALVRELKEDCER
jgi:8-oxo-dGTP pyrophosphatase MutT (NUDIX family)